MFIRSAFKAATLGGLGGHPQLKNKGVGWPLFPVSILSGSASPALNTPDVLFRSGISDSFVNGEFCVRTSGAGEFILSVSPGV